ncbi:tyrosine-type recombinase/integrase [Cellulomonas palmilytica]|uniref:tyrosine-type recombinase/integrase n=1 Tax=Cellulomonas palmilytica TaxID=2608402 RepID=UPI001F3B5D4B|nr:site-specific integrase [Cellulomonas palmilytica]UJP40810.1 site-specific integrase [Cellulomonas palmilytica]
MQKLADSKGKPIYKVRWRSRHAGVANFHSRSFRRLKDAEEFARDLRPGQDWTAARALFSAKADAWLQSRINADRRPRTIEHYRGSLRFALHYFDGVRVNEITPDAAEAFLGWLKSDDEFTRGLKTPRSIRGAWMPFRAVLAYAVRQGAIPSNPADRVELPNMVSDDARQDRYHYLTTAEVGALVEALAAMGREPYDLLVLFTAYTGLRRGEVAGLDVRHLRRNPRTGGWEVRVQQQRRRAPKGDTGNDPHNHGWLIETTKSGRSRTVPLPRELGERMSDYLRSGHPRGAEADAPLWPGRTHAPGSPNGVMDWSSPLDPQAFYRYHFKRAVADAGLPSTVRFHDLRHTYASHLAQQGLRPGVVARLMGHADPTITLKVYTHLWPEDLEAAVVDLRLPGAEDASPGNVVRLRGAR